MQKVRMPKICRKFAKICKKLSNMLNMQQISNKYAKNKDPVCKICQNMPKYALNMQNKQTKCKICKTCGKKCKLCTLCKPCHTSANYAPPLQWQNRGQIGCTAPARRQVAMGLELSGAGLIRGAFGSGSSAGPARRVTGSAFRGARPGLQWGSRQSRRLGLLGAGRGAGLRLGLLLRGSGPGGPPVSAAGRGGRR